MFLWQNYHWEVYIMEGTLPRRRIHMTIEWGPVFCVLYISQTLQPPTPDINDCTPQPFPEWVTLMFTAAVKLLRWSLRGTHISQILLPRLPKEQYHFQMDQKIHLCSGVFVYLWITYNVLCCHLRNTFYNPSSCVLATICNVGKICLNNSIIY